MTTNQETNLSLLNVKNVFSIQIESLAGWLSKQFKIGQVSYDLKSCSEQIIHIDLSQSKQISSIEEADLAVGKLRDTQALLVEDIPAILSYFIQARSLPLHRYEISLD